MRMTLLLLSLLPTLAFAQHTGGADRRPVNELLTLHTLNGAPEGGQVVNVSGTLATLTGLVRGAAYAVTCTVAAHFLPGSTVSVSTNGTAGQYLAASQSLWILMPTTATSLAFITSGSTGTCTVNRWR